MGISRVSSVPNEGVEMDYSIVAVSGDGGGGSFVITSIIICVIYLWNIYSVFNLLPLSTQCLSPSLCPWALVQSFTMSHDTQ